MAVRHRGGRSTRTRSASRRFRCSTLDQGAVIGVPQRALGRVGQGAGRPAPGGRRRRRGPGRVRPRAPGRLQAAAVDRVRRPAAAHAVGQGAQARAARALRRRRAVDRADSALARLTRDSRDSRPEDRAFQRFPSAPARIRTWDLRIRRLLFAGLFGSLEPSYAAYGRLARGHICRVEDTFRDTISARSTHAARNSKKPTHGAIHNEASTARVRSLAACRIRTSQTHRMHRSSPRLRDRSDATRRR